MGTLADFSVGIGADISDFTSGISKAVESTADFSNKLGSIASSTTGPLDGVGRAIGGIGDVAGRSGGAVAGFFRMAFADVLGGVILGGLGLLKDALGGIAGGMIGGNAAFEQYNVQFSKLIGNSDDFKEKYKGVTDPLELQALAAEEANQKMADLAAFGAATPFELPQVVEASKVLQGFGLNSKQAAEDFGFSGDEILTIAGDVAAGTGTDFAEMALNIGKFSKGATGESIARFMELGVLTRDELAKLGVEFSKSGELVSPLPEATEAMLTVMKEKYGGMMDAQSKTFNGMMSNIQDWVAGTLRTIGQPIFELLRGKLEKVVAYLASPGVQAAVEGFAQNIADGLGAVIGFVETVVVPAFQSVGNAISLITTGDFTGGIFGLNEDSLPITLLIDFATALDAFTTGSVNGFIAGLANAAYALAEWYPWFQPVGDALVLVGGIVDTFVSQVATGFAEGGVAGAVRAFVDVLSTVSPGFALISSAVETALPFVRDIVMSVFGIVAGFISEKGPEIRDTVVNAFNAIRDVVEAVSGVVNSVVTTVFGAVAAFVQENQESIRSVVDTVWNTIKTIIEAVIPIIRDIIIPAFEGIATFITEHGESIKGIIQGAWDIIKGIIEVVSAVIIGIINTFTAVVSGDWSAAWEAIKTMFSGVWEGIKGIVSGAATAVINALSIAWDAVKLAAQTAWDWLWNTAIGKAITGIVDDVKAGFKVVVDFLKDTWEDLKTKAEELWTAIHDNIIKPITDAYDTITGKVGDWVQMGKDLMMGLVQGIVDSVTAVVDAVVGAVGDAYNGALEWLGIRSPSRKFMYLGEMSMAGAALGVDQGAPALVLSTRSAAEAATDAMKTSIEQSRPALVTASTGTGQAVVDAMRTTIERGTPELAFKAEESGRSVVDAVRNYIDQNAPALAASADIAARITGGSFKAGIERETPFVTEASLGMTGALQATIEARTSAIIGAGSSLVDGLFGTMNKGIDSGIGSLSSAIESGIDGIKGGLIGKTNEAVDAVRSAFQAGMSRVQAEISASAPSSPFQDGSAGGNTNIFNLNASYAPQDERTVADDIRFLQAIGAST